MVFESLLNATEIRKKPYKTLFLGMLFTIVSIILSMWIFPSDPSLSMVFLTTMAGIPLLVSVLRIEEEEDFTKKEYPLIGNHKDVLGIVFFLFLGLLITFVSAYVMLPNSTVATLFNSQINTISSVGNTVNIQGNYINRTELLKIILSNNFKVLFFCIIFSLVYGAGALFIITWNASVLGTAIGNAIKTNVSSAASYISAIPMGFGQYMLHGLPELIAYFIAAIAGGIISVAVIRHNPKSKKFKEVLLDSIDLIIVASVVLIISGLIEVYISLQV